MRILIVGAGAVGLVYGRHLRLGGWSVDYYVKPKYAEGVAAGPVVYALNDRDRTVPKRLDGVGVVAGKEALAASEHRYDAVMLAISSTALHGEWLGPFLAALPDVPVVMLQPGFVERQLLEQTSPGVTVVQGLIPFLSYPAPLPGETRFPEPGTAYWLPWLTKCPFAGPAEVVGPLVDGLSRGGLPSKVVDDLSVSSAYASGTFNTAMAALEVSNWKFAEFRRGGSKRATAAARETWAVLDAELKARKPAGMGFWSPMVANLATRMAATFPPVDMETFLMVHFTKVGDQTAHHLKELADAGAKHGVPTPELVRLRDDLLRKRGTQG